MNSLELLNLLLCLSLSSTLCGGATLEEFVCDGTRVLDASLRCDGKVECDDKTDELQCFYDACTFPSNEIFRCEYGRKCILNSFRCDGHLDCEDDSDERNCSSPLTCPEELFACKDFSKCISRTFQCDGFSHCTDGSDEKNCHGLLHGFAMCRNRFSCGFGLCLADDSLVCNGKSDCYDGRDESHETCQSTNDCKKCEGSCHSKNGSTYCSCGQGFELGEDGFSCNDIDECSHNVCSQDCINSKGSFECRCKFGFNLINETKCESVNKPTSVWYRGHNSSFNEVIIERGDTLKKFYIPHDSMAVKDTVTLKPPMSYDVDKEKLYVKLNDTLVAFDLDKATPEPRRVVPPHVQLTHFAVDFVTGNVYFTSLSSKAITVCHLGGSCAPLLRRPRVVSRIQIANFASGAKLFWKEGSSVMESSLDGQETRLVYGTASGRLYYFVVDELTQKMYVADESIIEVDLTRTDKGNLRKIAVDPASKLMTALAVRDDVIYIQEIDDLKGFKTTKLDRLTGDVIESYPRDRRQLHAIQRSQEGASQNPCWNPDGCSHLCVIGSPPAWFKCLCPPGMYLDDDDERHCVAQQGGEQVLFVNGSQLSTFVFEDGMLYHNNDMDLRVEPLAIASNLDMELVYSTKVGLFALKNDGTRKEYGERLSGIISMVLDPVDDVLYAVNGQELLVISLKNSRVSMILDGVTFKHIDLDPLTRTLFLEGQHEDLHSMVIGEWKLVSLAEYADHKSTQQKSWVFDPFDGRLRVDVALVLKKGYCTLVHDHEMGFLCQTHKFIENRCFEKDHHNLRLITRMGPPLADYDGTACDATTCEFCVTAPQTQPVCVCPYGHEAGADGKSCSPKCSNNMLRCSSPEGKCIHQSRRCDGFSDCPDGSDEKACYEHDCKDSFKCTSNGVCVDKRLKCDGHQDCLDNSDESGCPVRDCGPGQFKCDDQTCIHGAKRCNGIADCFHQEDEKNCPKVTCNEFEFDCGNNKCIPKNSLCDEIRDCPNGKDEANCDRLIVLEKALGNVQCDPKENFCCKNGQKISHVMHCNNVPDCDDGSDEVGCSPQKCLAPDFRCKSGLCVVKDKVCDGIAHCPDAEDEHECHGLCAVSDLFECVSTGQCLSHALVCDGAKNCEDGSDEHNCSAEIPDHGVCFGDEFRCKNGQCISFAKVCDKKNHCTDGSDEAEICAVDCVKAGCSDTCYHSENGIRCSCREGFRLSSNGYSCEDVDECAEQPHVCSQECRNTWGGYECSCAPNFKKNAFGECRWQGDDPVFLLVADGLVEAVMKRGREKKVIFEAGHSHIGDIEYDSTGLVFVSEPDNNKVHRIPLEPKHGYTHEFYTHVKPSILALDWLTDNIYYADHRPSIHVCTRQMAGPYCTMLTVVHIKHQEGFSEPAVASMALVPDDGIMFYSEISTGFLYRQNMDGTEKTLFTWGVRERTPLSLTIDHYRRSLYWIDHRSGAIEESDFEGKHIRKVVEHLSYARTLAIYEDFIFVPNPENEHLQVFNKLNGQVKYNIHNALGRATDIKIMHQTNRPYGENRCKDRCQHICLLRPKGFACACTDGLELRNGSCVESSESSQELFDKAFYDKLREECQCENGGYCLISKMNTRMFRCKCPPGYHGHRCEEGATGSLVINVLSCCVFFILVAVAGISIMILLARYDNKKKRSQMNAPEGCDRLNLIEEEAEYPA